MTKKVSWYYDPASDAQEVELASLYCAGRTIGQMCPDNLKEKWETCKNRLNAHYRACCEAKIRIGKDEFYNHFIPGDLKDTHCQLVEQISRYVIENNKKPKNYDLLYRLSDMSRQIRKQKLNVDIGVLKSKFAEFRVRQLYKRLSNKEHYISYNIFGTKTGRLTTRKGSFPIMTLDKNHRSMIRPQNDFFVELDFNAAELRTLLALAGKEQPQQDIHEWNVQNVYGGTLTREEAKQRIFAWLYNPNSGDDVLQKYWDGTHVRTPFHREMEADRHHALNYIIQSTASDIFLDRLLAVYDYLKEKKSFISFSIHDSVVIDFAENERDSIFEIAQIFSQTIFSDFLVNISTGKNYGQMRELCRT